MCGCICRFSVRRKLGEKLREAEFDYIVIAVENKDIADKIKDTLHDMNIADEKTVWDLSIG